MTLTSAEAAEVLDVTTGALRMIVNRGRLTPIRPGAHPLRFHACDVYDLQVARRSERERAEHDSLWSEVDAVLALQVSAV